MLTKQKIDNHQFWWLRKKSDFYCFVIPDQVGNPVLSSTYGLPPSREWLDFRLFTNASILTMIGIVHKQHAQLLLAEVRTKGSLKNNFTFSHLSFRPYLVGPHSQNPRNSSLFLWFCSIGSTKSDPNLSVNSANLFLSEP